ncbi:MAG: alpha-L-fucosidase [Bacteroidota bacterium]
MRTTSLASLLLLLIILSPTLLAQEAEEWFLPVQRNKPERTEWFKDLGFGMFIHWSHDVQLGSVISHSMVGASPDYLDFYVNELPKTFNPTNFDPGKWADYAQLAGMKYVVFTAKHHSGFCMFQTETTDFSIESTPFSKDITKEVLDAFRSRGIAVGLYFSPDDFTFLYQRGLPIDRDSPKSLPGGNPELMEYTKQQLKELLTKYGKIDIMFLDGQTQKHEWINTELAAYCWDLDPDILVTRGGMKTPEQNLPNTPLEGPWEACFTMGTQWQYKPTNETYKSGTRLIEMLIETRAKGGNLLLNVGPDESGQLPIEQIQRLQEIALWRIVNQEAIYEIEPFTITNEDDVWYTKKPGENTVYAFVTKMELPIGERKELLLTKLKGSTNPQISVLGHDGKTLEYQPDAQVEPWCKPGPHGLTVSFTRSQRLYNDRKWPNPIVLKLENVMYQE